MTSPLDSRHPYGIQVVADRAPVREDVKAAFEKGSREATKGIASLTGRASRSGAKKATS